MYRDDAPDKLAGSDMRGRYDEGGTNNG